MIDIFPAMANVQPIQQPPIEDLRNALQALIAFREESLRGDLEGVERLLRHAIEGLSEPNLAAMQAGAILLKEWEGTPDERRQLRDTIQGILRAQLEGVVPKTWERE